MMGPIDARSKALFGNRHLLAVSARIAAGAQELRPRELQEALGLGPSTVHRTLAALSAAGLLERLPRRGGERDQRYQRLPHLFWEAAARLQAEADTQDGVA